MQRFSGRSCAHGASCNPTTASPKPRAAWASKPRRASRRALLLAGLMAGAQVFAAPVPTPVDSRPAHSGSVAHPAAIPADALARIKALGDHDPAAALRLGLSYWLAGPPTGERVELALQLLPLAEDAHQDQQVMDIGERLESAPLNPLQRMHVLGYLAAHAFVTRDVGKLKALEGKLASLDHVPPGQRENVARYWRSLAASYYFLDDVDDAQRVARIALSKLPKRPDKVEYNADQLIAIGYLRQGKIPEGIEWLLAADRCGKALHLPDDPMLMLNFTGAFIYTRNWPQVIAYGTRGLAAHPSVQIRASLLGAVAAAHAALGDIDQASSMYGQALALARSNRLPTASILNNWGDMLQKHHQPGKALPLFREAAAALVEAGDKSDAAVAYSNLGEALAELGHHQDAAKAFDQSLALFAVADDVEERLELYPRMIDNLAALGRYRDALKTMRTFKQVSDQHVNVESNTRIAKLQSVIQVAQQKSQLAEAARKQGAQTAELAALKAREQRQRLFDYGMLTVLVLLVLLALVKMRESRMRRRLNRELERRNTEIQARHHELTKLNEIIRRQSEEDALTGLHNRRHGQERLEQLVSLQDAVRQRGDTAKPSLLMLLDLDHFKHINDRFGHEAGDRALMHFSDLLRDCSRQADTLIRWGGEEFLWICPDTPLSEAPRLLARLREANLGKPLSLDGITLPLRASVGYCPLPVWPGTGGDWASSLRVADAALYRAKDQGRDCWVGFAPGPLAPVDMSSDIADMEAHGALVQLGGSAAPAAAPAASDA